MAALIDKMPAKVQTRLESLARENVTFAGIGNTRHAAICR
jgi:hypothetical protein